MPLESLSVFQDYFKLGQKNRRGAQGNVILPADALFPPPLQNLFLSLHIYTLKYVNKDTYMHTYPHTKLVLKTYILRLISKWLQGNGNKQKVLGKSILQSTDPFSLSDGLCVKTAWQQTFFSCFCKYFSPSLHALIWMH